MTSPYLENEPRELSDVIHMREWGDPADLGIPSDSPYEGTGMSPSTVQPVRYPTSAYVPTRFGTRTICDLPDEHDERFADASSDHRHRGRTWLVIALFLAAFWGLAGWGSVAAWDHFYPAPRRALPMVTGFEGGQ